MEQKKALNRKKLKVILVICIVMIVTAGVGLAAYIHHVDTVTLGRKVSVYRLDVSKLTVEEAQQKISEAFQNKKITFHEDGKDVYNVSMEQLGYSLDQDILKSALETLKQERSGTFKLFASQRDYKIDYQIIRDEAQEQAALSADHFDEKDRTEPTDAHIRYSKKKQKYVLVKQVSGNQIDENRLLSYVEETLDKDFETELLTSDVKMELNEEVYRQPDIEESGEMKQKVKKLNSLLKKYRSTTVSYLFGEETQVLDSYDYIYQNVLPEISVTSFMLGRDAVPGVPFSLARENVFVHSWGPEKLWNFVPEVPRVARVRVGFFVNGALAAWAEPDDGNPQPITGVDADGNATSVAMPAMGEEDLLFTFPECEVALQDGDFFCVAAVVEDQFGHERVVTDGVYQITGTGEESARVDGYNAETEIAWKY